MFCVTTWWTSTLYNGKGNDTAKALHECTVQFMLGVLGTSIPYKGSGDYARCYRAAYPVALMKFHDVTLLTWDPTLVISGN